MAEASSSRADGVDFAAPGGARSDGAGVIAVGPVEIAEAKVMIKLEHGKGKAAWKMLQ